MGPPRGPRRGPWGPMGPPGHPEGGPMGPMGPGIKQLARASYSQHMKAGQNRHPHIHRNTHSPNKRLLTQQTFTYTTIVYLHNKHSLTHINVRLWGQNRAERGEQLPGGPFFGTKRWPTRAQDGFQNRLKIGARIDPKNDAFEDRFLERRRRI